ncbi:MAG: tetratricopeptide repeat protein, partial [Gemmatimonadota bacterium]|nr:tetratricopeptide repeat protein [Gemmatimonadota bacterium]
GVLVAGQDVTASRVFQVLLLGHTGLGAALVVAMSIFAGLHLPRVWTRRAAGSLASGVLTLCVAALLLLSGLFILTEAATRSHRWVWWAHVAAAAGLPALYVLHRRASVVRSSAATARRLVRATVAVFVLFVGAHLVASGDRAGPGPTSSPPGSYARERLGVIPPGFADPESPFYPSPARTSAGGVVASRAILGNSPPDPASVRSEVRRAGAYTASGIGSETCVRCHPDVVEQWASSAHRYSSFNNPFYEAAIDVLREGNRESNWWLEVHRQTTGSSASVGVLKSRWCGACHDPALLFTGGLDADVDRSSVEAQAGLTCLACHAIESVHDRTGNGNYELRAEGGDPYIFAGVEAPGWRRALHDAALRARPDAHRASMLPGFMASPEVCTACHKVSLREPVNSYRWVRGQNEPDAWEDSGVSRENASTFYLPDERRVCRDCHMPLEGAPLGDLAAERGLVRSHRFVAANTALPSVRGDTAALRRTEEFLRDEKLSVDIFGLADAGGQRIEGLGDGPILVPAGTTVTFDVVVRNLGVGHGFPGGTVDSNQGWLEVHLLDEAGQSMAASGSLDPSGHLGSDAHLYGALFVDSAGRPIDRRNPQDLRATVFSNVIGPGSADLSHYRVRVPARPGRYVFQVRLLWRKFNRGYSEFAYSTVREAFPGQREAPTLPVTVVAEDRFTLEVVIDPEPGGIQAASLEPTWIRYNDYGIASLREGRTTNASRAFRVVDGLSPDRPDGPLNLARASLVEGNVAAALEHLEEAERRAPGNGTVAWLWGQAWQTDGQYERAAAAYRSALAAFPRHRASLMGLGRTLYLDGRLEAAVEVLDELLLIDPEHRAAWYHRMLSLAALGREQEAAEAGAMVEYLQVDEASGRLAQKIRLADPGVNRMSQSVRTYDLVSRSPE